MLLRISLIVAILAGIGAGVVSYLEVTDKIPVLAKQRDTEHAGKVTALADLSKTRADLAKTKSDLSQSQQDLADTKGELNKAVARADTQSKRANDLSGKLAKAIQERDEAQNLLASYKATDLTPDQITKQKNTMKAALEQIEAINAEKVVIQRKLVSTQARLSRYEGPDTFVKLRADLKGQITVVDPKWNFVVLNIGEEQGAIQDGELLVSRDGKLVGKVIIRSVQKGRSIANVISGWNLSDPLEGDLVTPAHPAS